jgi:hypothetical protein
MFQRLGDSNRYEGTGMGLAIVRKAIERMGGKVGVVSNEGKGSRFWIELREPTRLRNPGGRTCSEDDHPSVSFGGHPRMLLILGLLRTTGGA